MGNATESVTLKTGAEVPRVMVSVTILSLQSLLTSDTAAFIELVELARDPHHEMWANTGETLERMALTSGGKLHDVSRQIILATVEGEGFDLRLVNPLAT